MLEIYELLKILFSEDKNKFVSTAVKAMLKIRTEYTQ